VRVDLPRVRKGPCVIKLRELERADLADLNRWRNDADLLELLGNNFLFIAGAVDEKWYESYLAARDRNVRLAITLSDTRQYVGNVNLTGIHAVNRSAEFSILIGEKTAWGRGVGSEAANLMLRHAFGDLNLNRIYLTVLASNQRALRLYERLGFRTEGTQRQAVFKNGAFHDLVMMSLLRHEYRPSEP
jgi:RimJ/RimL family protein N-acetyltransferase